MAENKTWFAMEAKNEGETAEISIYDEIGVFGVQGKAFVEQLEAFDTAETINLRISSPGGSVVEGNLIYNAIKRHKARVNVFIDGMAASMASVIAMAGDNITMAENALMMIHNPWTVSIGDSEQLRKDADLMDKMKKAIINAYSRSSYSEEELEQMMNATTYFTAKEAVEAGFADDIDGALEMAASIADMNEIAQKAGSSLPIEKMIASAVQKHKDEVFKAGNELVIEREKLAKSEAKIEDLQMSLNSANETIKNMEATHEKELSNAKEVTAFAVAQKAAEIMGQATIGPVTDQSEERETRFKSRDEFWAEWQRQPVAERNDWYHKNKVFLPK